LIYKETNLKNLISEISKLLSNIQIESSEDTILSSCRELVHI